MNVPVFTWCAIVVLFAAVLVYRIAVYFHRVHDAGLRHHLMVHHHSQPFISMGSEREELYVPGDSTGRENYPPYASSRRNDYEDDIC